MGLLDMFAGEPQGEKRQPGLIEGLLSNPVNRALLSASAAAFEASGPSLRPVGFGQVVGRMVNAGMGEYDQALATQAKLDEARQMAAYRKVQTDEMIRKGRRGEKIDGIIFNRLTGGSMPDLMATADEPGQPPTFATSAPASALGQVGGVASGAPAQLGSVPMPTATGSQVQAHGQAFPFSLNDIAALKLGGYDLGDIYKLATDPIRLEGGSTYKDRATGTERYIPKLPEGMTRAPDGTVSLLPGFVRSNSAIKGGEAFASEEAKANFDPFYGVDEGGNKVLLGSRAAMMKGAPGAGLSGGTVISSPVVERNPAATQYENEMAKDYAARYKDIQNAALKAPAHIGKLEKLGKLLNDYEGGKLSGMALGLAQAANSMGIKIDPKLADKEAAVALANEMALSKRDPANGGGMPGAMSDADRQFLVSLTPNLAQSAQGRKLIIDAEVAVQRRNIDVQKMAAKYQRKYGRVDDGFYTQLQEWAERNPLFQQRGK